MIDKGVPAIEPPISGTFKKLPASITYRNQKLYITSSPKIKRKLTVKRSTGEYLFPQDFNHIQFSCIGSDTIILADDGGRKYVFNLSGATILSRDHAIIFTNRTHLFQRVKDFMGISTRIYNTKGQQVLNAFENDVEFMDNDSSLVIVKTMRLLGEPEPRMGLVDLRHERYLIQPAQIKISHYHQEHHFIITYRDTGRWNGERIHLVDSAMNPLSPVFYRVWLPEAKFYKNRKIFIGSADSASVFDLNGNQLLPWFSDIYYFEDSLFKFYTNKGSFPHRAGLIALNGKILVPASYTDIYADFSRSPINIEHLDSVPTGYLFRVANRDLVGVVDAQNGQELLKPVYDNVTIYSNSFLAWVTTKDGKSGYVNLRTGLKYFKAQP